jgi:polysaccharide pyruvyl transferase WcaK-like protein
MWEKGAITSQCLINWVKKITKMSVKMEGTVLSLGILRHWWYKMAEIQAMIIHGTKMASVFSHRRRDNLYF